MAKYNIWLQKVKPYKMILGASLDVNSEEELKELVSFIKAGINAYEDWRVERQ